MKSVCLCVRKEEDEEEQSESGQSLLHFSVYFSLFLLFSLFLTLFSCAKWIFE